MISHEHRDKPIKTYLPYSLQCGFSLPGQCLIVFMDSLAILKFLSKRLSALDGFLLKI